MGHWIITSMAGNVTAAPAANAPNVTFASAIATYALVGNGTQFGFSGVLNLPTGHVDYPHLKRIELTAYGPSGQVVPVCTLYAAQFSGNTIPFAGASIPQATASASWTLKAWAINDDGTATASPASTTVTVQAAAVSSISSPGEVGTRFIIEANKDRLPYFNIAFTPVLNGNQVPQNITYLVSADNGAKWTHINAALISSVGQQVQFTRPVPTAAATFKIAACAGFLPSAPTGADGLIADATLATYYPGIVRSAGFGVAAIATPAASNGITATVGAFEYRQDGPDKTTYGYIPPFTGTDPTSGADAASIFYFRIVITDLDASHNPIGSRKVHDGWQITGPSNSHTTAQPLLITLNGQAGIRYEVFIANKASKGAGDFSDATTNTLQSVAWNGGSPADHLDVMFGATPPSKVSPIRNGDNQLVDPGFENWVGWSQGPGALGSPIYVPSTTHNRTTRGAYGAQCVIFPTADGGFAQIYQVIPVAAGESVAFSAWYDNDPGAVGQCRLFCNWLDTAGTPVGTPAISSLYGVSVYTWAQMSILAGPAPAGAVAVGLGIQVYKQTGQPTPSGGWYFDDAVAIRLAAGTALTPTLAGGYAVNVAGPLYADVANNLNLHIASDFVVSGGVLTQQAVDLAKSVNFDTGQFDKTSGTMVIKALAVNKLIAGDALFAGDATFARSSGGKVTLNSAGVAIADVNTGTPNSNVTITASGFTAQRGTNAVQITSSGVGIYGPSGSLTATSGGVQIANGSSSVTVDATNGVTIVGGRFSYNTGGTRVDISPAASSPIGTVSGLVVADSSVSTAVTITKTGITASTSSGDATGISSLGFSSSGPAGFCGINNSGILQVSALPSSNPGAGSKRFWYDPADGNRVKFAP